MSKAALIKSIYVDSSVILHLALGEKGAYPLHKASRVFASELLWVECGRTLDRLRLQDRWDTGETVARVKILHVILDTLQRIPIDKKILKRAAEPFPTIIKTLDALHLASALRLQDHLGQPVLFVTHDIRQGLAATACGLQTEGYG